MTARPILITKRLFESEKPRQRPGVRRASGAFGRLAAYEKLQRAGALQNALALAFIAVLLIAAKPVQAQWEQLPSLPEPNGGFVCGHEKGKIVVIGGTNWEGGKKNWLGQRHEFDPVQKTWSTVPNVKEPISYAVVMQYEDEMDSDDFEALPKKSPKDPQIWFSLYHQLSEMEYGEKEDDWITLRKGGYDISRELLDAKGKVIDSE